MSKNGKVRPDIDEFNGRQAMRNKLAAAWLKENKPIVWEAIVQAAIKKFPLRSRKYTSLIDPEVTKFLSRTKEA